MAAGYTRVPGRGDNRTEDVAHDRGIMQEGLRRKKRKIVGL